MRDLTDSCSSLGAPTSTPPVLPGSGVGVARCSPRHLNSPRIVRRMGGMVVRTMLVAMLVGCTPGMHRAYQITMASAASGLFVFDGAQTVSALRSDPVAVEGNAVIAAVFGSRPSASVTWTIAGSQALGALAIPVIPRGHYGDDRVDYIKDFILTVAVAVEAVTVQINADQRSLPILRSWR